MSHLNGFFTSWTEDKCTFKLHFDEKVKQQMSHLKGFFFLHFFFRCFQLIEQLIQLSEVEKQIILQYYFWTGMKIFKKTDSVHWEVKQASE